MTIQHVVGYTETRDRFGTKYFKGQDGSICLLNPRDQRPSKMIFVKKVSTKEENNK